MNYTDKTGKLGHWWLSLSEHDVEIVHRVGVKHQAFDTLFKIPTDGVENTELWDKSAVMVVACMISGPNKKMNIVLGRTQKAEQVPNNAGEYDA